MKENPQSGKRVVAVFSIASFLHDMGSDIVFSVWPLFVTQVLGANMTVLGLIDGLGDAVVSLSQAGSGYLSDRIKKRKVFVWLGYLFGGVARIGYAASSAWQFLIPFRILDRSGKMRGSPRDTIIAEVSARENRGKNFGILRSMDNLGAVVGILISIFFLQALGYRKLFLLAAVPSVFATLLVLFFIKEAKGMEVKLYKGISLSDINNNLRLFILLNAIFALASFSYSFLLLYAKQYGVATPLIPAFYLIFTLVAAVTSFPFGKLADKIGRKKVLALSFLFWIVVLLFLLFSKNLLGALFAFVLYGFHKGALEPVQKTFAAELAPREFVASTLGGFQMVIGLVSLPASLFAGFLWDTAGFAVPLYVSLILTILSSILLMFVKE